MATHRRDKLSFWEKILFCLEKYAAFLFIMIIGSTYRYKVLTKIPDKPIIYAFWHRNIIPLVFQRKFEKAVLLISSSKDGELVAGPCRALGYITVRGSSRRNGARAAKEFIRYKDNHILAITPDGPKGPAEKIKEGLPTLSYLTKVPISFVSVDIDKEIVFNSWDKFRLPLPFSRINVSYTEPVYINSKEEIKSSIEKLEDAIKKQKQKNKIERG